MTPDLLRQVGEALYGERWQAPLGRDLNVADRTVRRWVAGTDQPRGNIAADLVQLLRARQTLVAEALAAMLERDLNPERSSLPHRG